MAEKLQALKQQVCCSIDEAKNKLHRLGDAIWSHPELAYEERQAHDTLVHFFTQETGWTVEAHYKLGTAFRATWGPVGGADSGSGVNVGFLCEYDALPGIGHACGHNLIAESGAAAAVGLKAALESREAWPVPIKITVLGTPAEENGGGKVDLLREGGFEGLDVVFMAHPSQEDAVYIPNVAAHEVVVKYHGHASHASAYPWEGVNALDAAVMAYCNMSVLRQQLRPDWRVHGIIRHGGVKPNIIPDYTELQYYLRTPSHRDLPNIQAKAEACFQAAALATGCRVELLLAKNKFYDILRNRTLEGLYEENGKALGMKFITVEDSSGSTDFGNVTHAVPGIHSYFYIGSEALNHTAEYTAASGADEAQFYTLRTAKALAMTALDVIFSPGVLDKVRQEFKEAKMMEEKGLKLQQVKHREAETSKKYEIATV
ncbi:peptidase M20 domain-containing protein 2-like [Neoarius graeffei]|uniref:peptidase M20 domain-containing protein 2-like n=1 Tax=Neoarius graeffei TaxID=443677 RepID=UPI00298C38ED|nr:peptidase M20 domain-containing protein 2-like [Neoarius graeffei]XP_060763321.1 peptidase M20 domain-containing protein 2-like [Neoarius graeffei]XP_060763332.1 peptidase M20 domain-containing protein 2-like [Neoarius graeffei]